jgi:hypothetical protein
MTSRAKRSIASRLPVRGVARTKSFGDAFSRSPDVENSADIQNVEDDVKTMLRIIAAIVAYEGRAYFPLLERLKREYDTRRRSDPAGYARRLLDELCE